MKAVFLMDVDSDELGEAVADITALESGICFFARGVIRPLPHKEEITDSSLEDEILYAQGRNDCIKEITG